MMMRSRQSRRILVRVVLALIVAFAAFVLWPRLRPVSAAERSSWLADHARLREHLESAYANFLERSASRHLDLPALDAATRDRIASARTRGEARAALQDLAAAFDDGHLRVRPVYPAWRRWLREVVGTDRPAVVEPVAFATPGDEACGEMGYRWRRGGPVEWDALAGWQPLAADAPFEAGTLAHGDATIAVLRIPLLSAEAYPSVCAAAWNRAFAGRSGSCDADCQNEFSLTVDDALAEALAVEVESLAARGAGVLVVDVTGNGGGSSIADPLARTLTATPLRKPGFGFVRHAHWVKSWTALEEDLDRDLARPDLSSSQRALLVSAREEATNLRREAGTPCDLSTLWIAGSPPPSCSNVARTPGFVTYAAPGTLDGIEARGGLFNASQYRYREGAWRGRLVVLTDGHTASAAEEFTALLRDNDAALVAGQPTLGIGCGYTNGGIPIELEATGLTVRAPDCVRYRADGSTEAAPIRPDIPVMWDGDGEARATAAIGAIAAAVAR